MAPTTSARGSDEHSRMPAGSGSVQHFDSETRRKAEELISVYPEKRSALLPLCHLAQSVDGWLCPDAMREIAELVGVLPAEVLGTASFYDLLHTEKVGHHVVSVCTNIACLLRGGEELLAHAESTLGISPGSTDAEHAFTLEEAECLAACDRAPCAQVNGRFFGPLDPGTFDALIDDLRKGALDDVVPPHGVISRVARDVGLEASSANERAGAGSSDIGSGSGGRG